MRQRRADVVERLGGEHLVEIVDDGEAIRLIDPVRDYLRCRGKNDLKGWHARLLAACRRRCGGRLWQRILEWYRRDEGGRRFMHHLKGCNGELLHGSLGAITTLHLDQITIGLSAIDQDLEHLAKALKVNTSLTKLNLFGNSIGDEGAMHLTNALKVNTSLTKLNLNANSIGAEGAKHLAEAHKLNTSLTTLGLSSNDIGDEGAEASREGPQAEHEPHHALPPRQPDRRRGRCLHLAEARKPQRKISVGGELHRTAS